MTTKLASITARRQAEFAKTPAPESLDTLIRTSAGYGKPPTLKADKRRTKRTDQVWAAMVIPLILHDAALTAFKYPDPFKAIRKSKYRPQTIEAYAAKFLPYETLPRLQITRIEATEEPGIDPEIAAERRAWRAYSEISPIVH